MTESVISIAHLHKSYQKLKAVVNLSFEVRRGTCFAILGPNGAGKTTAIKTIYGKARVDAHKDTTMSILGYDPRKNELAIKALAGVVQQDNNLDYELNVEKNLLIYARFYGMPKRQAQARIDELLTLMELQGRRDTPTRALSGGMKRRLIIARALLNNPRLLILDEPTTGLDLQVRDLIWDRMNKLKQEGVTILLTTHYMEEARQLSDRIMIMHQGRKILEGKPDYLLTREIEPHVLVVGEFGENTATGEGRMGGEAQASGEAGAGGEAQAHGEASASGGQGVEIVEDGIRFAQVGTRGFFYSASVDALKRQAEYLRSENYSIRNTNLEDVFMKATGGTLGEQQ